MSTNDTVRPPLAVVGVSALFPGSVGASGFWSDILQGSDLITDVPASHWLVEDYYDPDPSAPDKTYAKRGGFLPKVDFDAMAWGVPPSTIPATDTAQLLALIVARQVLEDAAQGDFEGMDKSRISVILGVTSAQELLSQLVSRLQRPVWVKALREAGLPESKVDEVSELIASNYVGWQEASFPGLLGNVVSGRIANRLDLGGTNCVTDAACASTFSALSMAANELYLGDSDMVVAGGVDTMNDIFMYMCFSKTPALSMSGDCRPFSDKADGTMLSEGLGMVAIKRLADAERDGDRIYAVIKGVGASSDGGSTAVYAPVSAGQAKSLHRAYERAGFGPDTIELVEAHGTGTRAGDAAEFNGLRSVFEAADREDTQWCALGSVKSQIGHAKAAAGAAGLFKTVMALHHKVLPPTIKIDRPNPKIEIETSPFHLNTVARPWIRGSDHPRRAGVSAFGFGGSNFHVALEEYTGPGLHAPRLRSVGSDLVLLSADSASALSARARELADGSEQSDLAWIAASAAKTWSAEHGFRLGVTAGDEAELARSLRAAADAIDKTPDAGFSTPTGTHYGVGPAQGDVAFVFPGQGSQYVGMGAAAAMHFAAGRAPWDAAADADFGGERLQDVVFPIPAFTDEDRTAQAARLTRTEWAQPGIVAASLGTLGLLREAGVAPSMVAGHSLGEVTALHAGGVIAAGDVVSVARRRGELMAEAAQTPGAMLAVTAEADAVAALVEAKGLEVVLANHNHPTQIVLSGSVSSIEAAEAALSAEGLRAKRLPVATAFHSAIVAPAAGPLREHLDGVGFAEPVVPVYSNAAAAPYAGGGDVAREALASAVAEPVRFVEMIEAMYAAGARTFVEVGPGSVLTGLVGRILGDRDHVAVATDRKGKDGVRALLSALGRLAAAGVPLDLSALWAEYGDVADPAAKPKPRLAVPIDGSNYGKLYPPPGGAADLPAPNPEPAPTPAVAAAPTPPPTPQVSVSKPPSSAPSSSGHRVPVAPVSGFAPAPSPGYAPAAAPYAPAAPPAPAPPAQGLPHGWIDAWQEAQRHTAQAHAAFQDAMSRSHAAYLDAAQASFMGLTTLTGPSAGAGAWQPAPAPVAQPGWSAPQPQPAWSAPQPQPAWQPAPVAPAAVAPAPTPVAPAPTPVAAPVAPAPTTVVAPSSPTVDLHALMLEVVADKTGYPAEMLSVEMDLEGDLGIDSIKRVEILSAVQDGAPGMPDVDPAHMGSLRTLGEIVDYMQGLLGAPAAPVSSAPSAPSVDLHALMLDVVADKTGYPAEMLSVDMDLEGDLGIDSIKRVEILSAVQDGAPGMPDVDPAHMGSLRTLGEIVDYMQGLLGAPAPGASSTPSAPSVDLHALMLDVVADKTGYPAEMLALDMDLEGDLGIDSIKRVEILSAVQDGAPGMPDVDPAHMGSLRTLGEIVDYMQGLLGGGAPAPAATPTEPVTVPLELGRFALDLVEAPALGLALPKLWAGPVRVTDDGRGVAPALVELLRERGIDASLDAAAPTGLIVLGGLSDITDDDAAIAINRDAFRAARAAAATLTGGLMVTVQDTGGRFGVGGIDADRALLGGLAALAKTARQEWDADVRAIDLQRGGRDAATLARAIADELLLGGGEIEVGLDASGVRRTLQSVREDVVVGGPRLGEGDVVVVSGGARGVTAASVVALAQRTRASFALLGRSAIADEPACCAGVEGDAALKKALLADASATGRSVSPKELGAQVRRLLAAREIRGTLAAIEAAGGRARYLSVDVTDAAGLSAALADVRGDWGPIKGVVHGAGVLADKLIGEKTDEQFDRVFDTKVLGLRALLAATAEDPLEVLCLFSSVAARCGNSGQVDYAMANEILNKVAQVERARRPGLLVKSMGWGPWEGGMVTPALSAHFASLGVPLIPLDVGAAMFADELQSGGDRVELVLGGRPRARALASAAKGRPPLELAVHLSSESHPYLESHSIAGTAVVPVVLVLDWLCRTAKAFRPELQIDAVSDVKVLRGIKLDGYRGAGDRVHLRCDELSNGDGALLALEVDDPDGRPLYRAQVSMVSRTAPLSGAAPDIQLDDWGGAAIYDGAVLFHGEDFQVIDRVQGISDLGASATLRGLSAASWKPERWQLDVAAFDGALQLAILWARRLQGGGSLPTGIAEVRVDPSAAVPTGPIQCVVVGRESTKQRTLSDIVLLDEAGRRFAQLRGVETHLRPDLPAAAARA